MNAAVAIMTIVVFVMGLCISVLGIDERDPYILMLGAGLVVGTAIILVVH